jgi:hypothetical protein
LLESPQLALGLIRSGFYSKSLTNYFIASNQIVNDLRREQSEYENPQSLIPAGLESRLGNVCPSQIPMTRASFTQKSRDKP